MPKLYSRHENISWAHANVLYMHYINHHTHILWFADFEQWKLCTQICVHIHHPLQEYMLLLQGPVGKVRKCRVEGWYLCRLR